MSQSVKSGHNLTQELSEACKVSLVSSKNIITIGNCSIRWAIPKHHLAYKRLEYLGLNSHKKCALQDVNTADLEKYRGFNIFFFFFFF